MCPHLYMMEVKKGKGGRMEGEKKEETESEFIGNSVGKNVSG